jgi:bleomycin hydrolase
MKKLNIYFINNFFCILLGVGILFITSNLTYGQGEQNRFTMVVQNAATPVKDQAMSSTCWSFGTISFIESELLRMGKGKYDLSEMFIVHNIYPEKAENFIRWHGKVFFTPGGQSHDVMHVINEYGLVPESAYMGKESPRAEHNHTFIDSLMKNITRAVLKAGRPGHSWESAINKLIDIYLGPVPETFEYHEQTYTPSTFAASTGLNPDDYIEITSYMDHPYYQSYVLDSKYNWSHYLYYNVPLDDFMEIINYSLKNGYTLAWDGDVSENEFSFENAIALVPQKEWNDKSSTEQNNTFLYPVKEVKVTPELRQSTFNSGKTTIDHIMHITGIATDQKGKKFYYTKNSWGEFNGDGGYMYLSESYIKLKTVAFMVNKAAIPEQIALKLGFSK